MIVAIRPVKCPCHHLTYSHNTKKHTEVVDQDCTICGGSGQAEAIITR